MGKWTQYNFVGRVLLKTSSICGSWFPKSVATCLMSFTSVSIISTFSSIGNYLHAGSNCSCVLPILEYCCLKRFCKPTQSTFISLSNSYHNLATPAKVKQNLCTWTCSGNSCVSIQSFILSRCTSASWSKVVISGTVHWFDLKTSFHPLLWTSSGLKGTWKTKHLYWFKEPKKC